MTETIHLNIVKTIISYPICFYGGWLIGGMHIFSGLLLIIGGLSLSFFKFKSTYII